ncbi:MAG: hypothetical protein ACLFUS_09740 [Candidatus Sumerlaeia bacterium]
MRRFEGLKQLIADLQKPEAFPEMLDRALDYFRHVESGLYKMRLARLSGDEASMRYEALQFATAVMECLALANQIFFDKGLADGLRGCFYVVARYSAGDGPGL